MDDYKFSIYFGNMLTKVREDAGQTRPYMAKACGVSIKTIQNWEEGYSVPNARYQFKWFKVLNKQPLPYYLAFLYPDMVGSKDTYTMTDKEIDEALDILVHNLPSDSKRDLLYILRGEHGSSPTCVLKMIVLHLSYPIKERIGIAKAIINNFTLASASGKAVHSKEVEPNVNLVKSAVNRCTEAVLSGSDSYTSILYGLSKTDHDVTKTEI